MFPVHRLLAISKRLRLSLLFLIVMCLFFNTSLVSSLLLPAQAQADDAAEENDDDDEAIPSRLQITNGITQIQLTAEEQLQSGVISKTLAEIHYQPEQRVFGTVMNIQGLIQLRSRYQNALSERAISSSALATAQQNYQRLKQLHTEAIIPTHKLQRAQSAWQSEQIKLKARDNDLHSIRATAEQTWGRALTDSTLDEPALIFQPLLNRQQVLIRVSLKAEQSLLVDTSFIFIARDPDRQKAHKAYLISAAPQVGTVSQGESYFFRSKHVRLPIGMQIHAWIPQAGQSLTGVLIPESAVVWYAGKPWVYLQTDAKHFSRQAIPKHHLRGHARFVSDAVFQHNPVVITGGQMLLSEEFRWQIPQEDDD